MHVAECQAALVDGLGKQPHDVGVGAGNVTVCATYYAVPRVDHLRGPAVGARRRLPVWSGRGALWINASQISQQVRHLLVIQARCIVSAGGRQAGERPRQPSQGHLCRRIRVGHLHDSLDPRVRHAMHQSRQPVLVRLPAPTCVLTGPVVLEHVVHVRRHRVVCLVGGVCAMMPLPVDVALELVKHVGAHHRWVLSLSAKQLPVMRELTERRVQYVHLRGDERVLSSCECHVDARSPF